MSSRPPFIVSAADVPETRGRYPNSDEELSPKRSIGRAAGLRKIGLHLIRLTPGTRTSWPHAESAEEEFAYVVCHTFLNAGDRDAVLLAGGEADKAENRIYYPLHPRRRADLPWSAWWEDAPVRPQGPHDGEPRRK